MSLNNIQYFSINNKYTILDNLNDVPLNEINASCVAWIAIAELPAAGHIKNNPTNLNQKNDNLSKPSKLSHEQLGVRTLLNKLLDNLDIQDTLVEDCFPYRLNKNGYFVSFSHSQHQVSCAISSLSPIAIDSELNDVTYKVAKRFYHPNEISWLNCIKTDDSKIDTKQQAINCLWMLKECGIKLNSYPNLVTSLKQDYSHIAKSLIRELNISNQQFSLLEESKIIGIKYADNNLFNKPIHIIYIPNLKTVCLITT